MIFPLIQVLVTAVILAYAGYWRRRQSNRRTATWPELVAKLRRNSEFGFDEVATRYLFGEGINATTQDIWSRIDGPKGLWAMYTNAGVFIQLADYASEHGDGVPEELIEGLRSDAFQIRMCVMMALAQYGFSRASEGVRVNAFRAATMYTGMAARMTQMLQDVAPVMVPDFVAAM